NNGFSHANLSLQQGTQTDVKFCSVAQPCSLAQIIFCQIEFLESRLCGTKSVMELWHVRAALNRPLKKLHRSGTLAGLMQQAAHQVERIRLVWILLESFLVYLGRGLDIAGPMKMKAPLDLSIGLTHIRQ